MVNYMYTLYLDPFSHFSPWMYFNALQESRCLGTCSSVANTSKRMADYRDVNNFKRCNQHITNSISISDAPVSDK